MNVTCLPKQEILISAHIHISDLVSRLSNQGIKIINLKKLIVSTIF